LTEKLISDIITGVRPCKYIEFELGVMKSGEEFKEYKELKDILDDRKQPTGRKDLNNGQ
jgi:hypothetical protein